MRVLRLKIARALDMRGDTDLSLGELVTLLIVNRDRCVANARSAQAENERLRDAVEHLEAAGDLKRMAFT